MASNASTIWNFLASKGLGPIQIAGIMGNLDVESGFNPGAPNPAEGAIGIAQWEGGRRTALQQFAASRGTSETDLGTQLDFLWSELTTRFGNALSDLQHATSASQAAAIWDGEYEISAGTSRTQRIDDATNFLNAFSKGGVAALDSVAPSSNSGGGGVSGSSASTVAAAPSESDYEQALGSLSGLLQAVPELKQILDKAISGGWSVTTFQQALQQTDWWKTHNDAAKSLISLQYQDPAEYATKTTNARYQIENLAKQLGVNLGPAALAGLVQQFMINGWDTQSLQNAIGKSFDPNSTNPLSGNIATAFSQVKQIYQDYGIPASDASLRAGALQVAEGAQSLDAYKQQVIASAKSLYPSIGTQLDAGMTTRQIADPYIQTMSNLLEIDPNNLGLTDPTIKKALQGTTTVGANGQSSSTTVPLWQFEQQVRSDPRWAMTNNARQSMSTLALQIGRDWGFAS